MAGASTQKGERDAKHGETRLPGYRRLDRHGGLRKRAAGPRGHVDGTAFAGAPFPDMTCGNWTKGGADGAAMTGHFDRAGTIASPWATSWNSSHPTLGCNMERTRPTGGDGLLYCFAAK
jgi:hypothetical protein